MNIAVGFFAHKRLWRVLLGLLMINGADALFAQSFTPPPPPTFQPPNFPMNFNNYAEFKGSSKRYLISAYLNNGMIVRDSSGVFYSDFFRKTDHIQFKEQKIIPSETDSLVIEAYREPVKVPLFRENMMNRKEEFRQIGPFTGIPHGDVWVWRTTSGKLNMYTENMESNLKEYLYLQKGESLGSMMPFSTDALEEAVADNPGAMKCVRAYRTGKIIYISMMVTGAVLAGYGFMSIKEPSGPTIDPRITVFGGAAIFVGAAIPYFMTKNKLATAVERYNE